MKKLRVLSGTLKLICEDFVFQLYHEEKPF